MWQAFQSETLPQPTEQDLEAERQEFLQYQIAEKRAIDEEERLREIYEDEILEANSVKQAERMLIEYEADQARVEARKLVAEKRRQRNLQEFEELQIKQRMRPNVVSEQPKSTGKEEKPADLAARIEALRKGNGNLRNIKEKTTKNGKNNIGNSHSPKIKNNVENSKKESNSQTQKKSVTKIVENGAHKQKNNTRNEKISREISTAVIREKDGKRYRINGYRNENSERKKTETYDETFTLDRNKLRRKISQNSQKITENFPPATRSVGTSVTDLQGEEKLHVRRGSNVASLPLTPVEKVDSSFQYEAQPVKVSKKEIAVQTTSSVTEAPIRVKPTSKEFDWRIKLEENEELKTKQNKNEDKKIINKKGTNTKAPQKKFDWKIELEANEELQTKQNKTKDKKIKNFKEKNAGVLNQVTALRTELKNLSQEKEEEVEESESKNSPKSELQSEKTQKNVKGNEISENGLEEFKRKLSLAERSKIDLNKTDKTALRSFLNRNNKKETTKK